MCTPTCLAYRLGFGRHEPEISPAKTKGIKANKSEPESAIRLSSLQIHPHPTIPERQRPRQPPIHSNRSFNAGCQAQTRRRGVRRAPGGQTSPKPAKRENPFHDKKNPRPTTFFSVLHLIKQTQRLPRCQPIRKGFSFLSRVLNRILPSLPPGPPPYKASGAGLLESRPSCSPEPPSNPPLKFPPFKIIRR